MPQNFVARDLPSRFPITLMASPKAVYYTSGSTETKEKRVRKKWQQHHSFLLLDASGSNCKENEVMSY